MTRGNQMQKAPGHHVLLNTESAPCLGVFTCQAYSAHSQEGYAPLSQPCSDYQYFYEGLYLPPD